MSDDIYYYRDRCADLEAELAEAKKTIAKYERRLYDIKKAVNAGSVVDAGSVVARVAWLAYDWKD